MTNWMINQISNLNNTVSAPMAATRNPLQKDCGTCVLMRLYYIAK